MNLFADIRAHVISCLDALVAEGVLPDGLNRAAVTVEPPRDACGCLLMFGRALLRLR